MDKAGVTGPAPGNTPQPEGRCWIEDGMLRVEVPLFMPNGEYVAYGLLHKAALMVTTFFKVLEREAAEQKGPRILTPAGIPRVH